MPEKENKIIIDTNLWISFLLTKNYPRLENILFSKKSRVIFSPELLNEFIHVIQKPKLKKYFTLTDIEYLLSIFDSYGELIQVHTEIKLCRDIKDNFLLSLAIDSKADYLLTGDNDLLSLEKIGKTKILTISQFEKITNLNK